MYRLLIVDDERIVRESVYGLLATQNDMELELLAAESAVRAVSILETERIDIAIMDINMPQMTGLELYDVVREKWPSCKVIFLTGYSEFDYVYKVQKHAKYVLKADREEILVEAVRDAIREIENEMIITRAADVDAEYKKRAGGYRSSDFMNELIDGYTDIGLVSNEILRDMNISLDMRKNVFPLLVRCESIVEVPFERRQVLCEKIMMLLMKYFLTDMECVVTVYKKIYYFLLVQPGEALSEAAEIRRLSSLCSLFQSALQLNAETAAAILIPDRAMDFREAVRSFGLFYDGLIGVETGDTQIFACRNSVAAQSAKRASSGQVRMEILQLLLRLEYHFETASRDEIVGLIRTVRENAQDVTNMHDLFFMEVYLRISSLLLKTIKQYEIGEQLAFQLGIADLYNIFGYQNWTHAFSRLEAVVQRVIELHEKNRSEQQEGLVAQIKRYIQGHLNEGTSLTVIADHFHFSREYLLRLFKKEEGITILQYINDLKLKRAKELLRNPDLQVKDIAHMLGFGSTGYFIRFFKSKTEASPQAYREKKKNARQLEK